MAFLKPRRIRKPSQSRSRAQLMIENLENRTLMDGSGLMCWAHLAPTEALVHVAELAPNDSSGVEDVADARHSAGWNPSTLRENHAEIDNSGQQDPSGQAAPKLQPVSALLTARTASAPQTANSEPLDCAEPASHGAIDGSGISGQEFVRQDGDVQEPALNPDRPERTPDSSTSRSTLTGVMEPADSRRERALDAYLMVEGWDVDFSVWSVGFSEIELDSACRPDEKDKIDAPNPDLEPEVDPDIDEVVSQLQPIVVLS